MNLQFSARSIKQNHPSSSADLFTPGYSDLSREGLQMSVTRRNGDGSLETPFHLELTLSNVSDSVFQGVVQIELPASGKDSAHFPTAPEFFLPGFMYGTNRGDAPIKVENKYPRLRPGRPELPASPWWMVRSDRLSHPAAFLYLPGDGESTRGHLYGISASPYLVPDSERSLQQWKPDSPEAAPDSVRFTGFTCSLERGSVGYTLGYENAPWLFIQSHTIRERAPISERSSILLAPGSHLQTELFLYDLEACDERILYRALESVYRIWHQTPRRCISGKEAAADLMQAVSRYAWLPEDRNYSGFVREKDGSFSYNRIFSISWTNGLSTAVPVLMAALRLGDDIARRQSLSCIDNIVQNSINPNSGLPFETWDRENGWSCRGWWYDGMQNGGHSGYLDGQTVYYILKAFECEKDIRKSEHPEWLSFAHDVLLRLHAQRNSTGEYPFVLSSETGAGMEYDALGSCWCLAALAKYLLVCRNSAPNTNPATSSPGDPDIGFLLSELETSESFYYNAFVRKAICYGAPLDTNKTVDSEGVLSYIRAVRMLHELTGKKEYLDHLRDALCYEYSFKLCYNTPVQVPPLSVLHWSSCGGSITSVANPHIHPMSSTVMDEMLYYLRFRTDSYIRSRLEDTVLWSLQTFNTHDGEYGYGRTGWMSERFCHCEGLLVEKYPDGSPASTWFALMPWACGSILEGICGDLWNNRFSSDDV